MYFVWETKEKCCLYAVRSKLSAILEKCVKCIFWYHRRCISEGKTKEKEDRLLLVHTEYIQCLVYAMCTAVAVSGMVCVPIHLLCAHTERSRPTTLDNQSPPAPRDSFDENKTTEY